MTKVKFIDDNLQNQEALTLCPTGKTLFVGYKKDPESDVWFDVCEDLSEQESKEYLEYFLKTNSSISYGTAKKGFKQILCSDGKKRHYNLSHPVYKEAVENKYESYLKISEIEVGDIVSLDLGSSGIVRATFMGSFHFIRQFNESHDATSVRNHVFLSGGVLIELTHVKRILKECKGINQNHLDIGMNLTKVRELVSRDRDQNYIHRVTKEIVISKADSTIL